MVFNSGVFIYFFVVVFLIYHAIGMKRTALQNLFLLAASYFFYGYWDWLFLGLILISTLTDYFVAIGIERSQSQIARKRLLILSVCVNLGILGTFKYFDFFVGSFIELVHRFAPAAFPDGGASLLLHVILPVGISFYTFQTMSYTIDVYRGVVPAERDPLVFALFVCFFPQLVAGPIERAKDLIVQIRAPRRVTFDDLSRGAWLILLGFFMKVYVADTIGPLVDKVFLDSSAVYRANPALAAGHGGLHVWIAGLGFILQIYCDFAGYSNIALGTARMLGFTLTENFNTPEFSQSPGETWRRWHVTLNRWVTDYIYIPLGGSRHGVVRKERNLLFAFLLMGLWHGANWTFLLWGFVNGLLVVANDLLKERLPRLPADAPLLVKRLAIVSRMVLVFGSFVLTGMMFRSYDLAHIRLLFDSVTTFPYSTGNVKGVGDALSYFASIAKIFFPLFLIDVMTYRKGSIFWIFEMPVWLRATVYSFLFYTIVVLGVFGRDVIYFAF